MSRIHDALKKAEQERVASATPRDAAGASEVTEPGSGPVERSASQMPEGAEVNPPLQAEANPDAFLLSTLAGRCRQYSWHSDPKRVLDFGAPNHVVGAEEFRTLRSRLYLMRKERPLQKLVLTSPLPREGKTFVAVNLALAIVQQPEHRVLLIDSDLRVSGLHLALGAPLSPGLSDYLDGKADEFSIVQRGAWDNFFFIPAGESVSNPAELIANGRIKQLLHRLGPVFDWIILDSPPVIPVSDAKLLADVCDGVLMMVLRGATPFDLAQKACQEFRGRRLIGVVLNGVKGGSAYSAYYYLQRSDSERNNGKG